VITRPENIATPLTVATDINTTIGALNYHIVLGFTKWFSRQNSLSNF
jgi:hypothetical protein